MVDLYKYGTLSVDKLNDKVRQLQEEQASIQATIDSIKVVDINSKNRLDIAAKAAHDIYHNWTNLEIAAQIELLDMLIDRVIVSDTGLDIIWSGGVLADE